MYGHYGVPLFNFPVTGECSGQLWIIRSHLNWWLITCQWHHFLVSARWKGKLFIKGYNYKFEFEHII